MGGGNWSDSDYRVSAAFRASRGISDFDYSDRLRSAPISDRKAHVDLDPKGVKMRESRDSDEHPNSKAVAIFFDVTGSMGGVPPLLQQKLSQLFGLLLRNGYIEDPQIMMGAIGDGISDRVPLQAGQFESDIRIDENLRNIFLERGGGGGNHESYELAMYFMARHTSIDCWEKRGEKGYLFIIGDERAYTEVNFHQVEAIIGDKINQNIPIRDILEEVKERYHVFYIHPRDGSYVGDPLNVSFWEALLGQNYIQDVETDAVCETIAVTIGMMEATVDLDAIPDHLKAVGTDSRIIASVTKMAASLPASTTAVAKSSGSGLPGLTGTGGSQRL